MYEPQMYHLNNAFQMCYVKFAHLACHSNNHLIGRLDSPFSGIVTDSSPGQCKLPVCWEELKNKVQFTSEEEQYDLAIIEQNAKETTCTHSLILSGNDWLFKGAQLYGRSNNNFCTSRFLVQVDWNNYSRSYLLRNLSDFIC